MDALGIVLLPPLPFMLETDRHASWFGFSIEVAVSL